MTAHALSAHADSSLAALAFAEAMSEGNRINWGHMLDHTAKDDLLVGLTIVVVKLAQALAARSECSLGRGFRGSSGAVPPLREPPERDVRSAEEIRADHAAYLDAFNNTEWSREVWLVNVGHTAVVVCESVPSLLTELASLRRVVRAVRAEIDCAETTGDKGCCSACEGTGYSGDESTGGQCWDCRSTGHPHGPVTGEDLPGFIAALRAALAAAADLQVPLGNPRSQP